MAAVRAKPILVAACVLMMLLATAGPTTAATVNGGISSLGSGYAVNSQTSGFGFTDLSRCDVGAESLQTGDVAYARCSVEYDISALPAGGVVTDAKLNVYTPVNNNCAGSVCGMVVSGYVGNAAFEVADLTAGSPLGGEAMGLGTTVPYTVTNFVQTVQGSSDLPIVGFNLARDAQNPADDRLTVGLAASAPTLVITYGIPVPVTVAVTGSGTVAAEKSSINCPGTCTDTYLPGKTVVLHASPANGFAFGSWTGSVCAGQGDVCSFTMPTTATSVTAAFLSTAPPTPTATPKVTKAPGSTGAPVPTGVAPSDETPSIAPQPSDGATLGPSGAQPSTRASASGLAVPTINGLESPADAVPTSGIGGVGGILIAVVAIILVIGGIAFAAYRVGAARAAKP